MPTWGGILKELVQGKDVNGVFPLDLVRRKYLTQIHQCTGRNVILYATNFTQPLPPNAIPHVAINDEDLQGVMEVVHGLRGDSLDLILHSPGGSLEAAEGIVVYLRSKFTNIRVFVPQLAQSAATMIACAANEIYMGKHSFLGPIDPQAILNTPLGQRSIPMQAILDQFDKAKKECVDQKNLPAWIPMLQQYGPDLLVQCTNWTRLSRQLVEKWLATYMFAGQQDAAAKAKAIADWLGSHNEFNSHGRHLSRQELHTKGLNVKNLEDDQQLQDAVLSVFHATTHTFTIANVVKIIENQNGSAFIRAAGVPAAPPVHYGFIRRSLRPIWRYIW